MTNNTPITNARTPFKEFAREYVVGERPFEDMIERLAIVVERAKTYGTFENNNKK